jgi:ribonuclease D
MIVDTPLKVDRFVEALSQTTYLAIDTETNLTQAYHDRFLVGISFCTDTEDTFYIQLV